MDSREERRTIVNRLLLAFPSASLERIEPHLESVDLVRRQVIHHVGTPTEYLYFIERGLISLIKTMQDGRVVEIGAIGVDGVVGLFGLHGVRRAIWEAIVQIPGQAFRIKLDALQSEVAHSPLLRRLIERCTYVAVTELAQTAACNRLHSLEQRCCRWLLIAHDGARADTFPLTHEFLALMLGVQRAGLTLTAGELQKQGLIRYTRGRVTVTNRPDLEKAACECYGTIRSQLDQMLESSEQA